MADCFSRLGYEQRLSGHRSAVVAIGLVHDLNDGTIKWRVADGVAPGVVGKVTTTTGTVRPQNSPVVTAGGLVFLANSQDCFLRAFDKATGELRVGAGAGSESRRHAGRLPGGRTAGTSPSRLARPGERAAIRCGVNPLHRKQAKIEAQGYHVYASPLGSVQRSRALTANKKEKTYENENRNCRNFGVCMATLVAQQNQAPAFRAHRTRMERVTWRTRTLVANDRLTNWDLAVPGHGASPCLNRS